MTYKSCSACQTRNYTASGRCTKCGHSLLQQPVRHERRGNNLYLGLLKRLFSSALVLGAVVSVYFGLMAMFQQPTLSLLPF
ncbi:MAG: hypothetical protein ACO1RX_07520 [Candidatus Sericytochromatia bacterium]